MSLQLSTHPVADPAQLALIADPWTPLGRPFADAFRAACEAEAFTNAERLVDPNRVRARLIAEFGPTGYKPQQLSALWCSACSPKSGYLVKTDRPVRISGEGSRGNGNKSTVYRRWVA